mmetsp:Transcript_19824/g.45622  ORF Transcript_19824/g.45622 Transcript_19824/m.45622 type:complete len:124 (-) Transcript_19824:724-1095(-)
MFFVNVIVPPFKNQTKKLFAKKRKASDDKSITMKNFSNSFSEKITRKNFFGKFWFCFSTIGIDFSFENKNFAMAENLEKNSLAFSTKSGLKIIDFLPGEAQMPQWGDFVIINYVLYKNSSQKN